jgi:hypothetical protein
MADPDADKPVAKLQLDTRSDGPWECEECHEEMTHVFLMEDGGVCCPHCKGYVTAFQEMSDVIVSAKPVKLKRHQPEDVGRTGAFELEDEDED